jgi:hypothetical protein
MIATVLIGFAAGAASALMFASIISGALISIVLVDLAALPLMVAAIGWGQLAAGVAGIFASLGVSAIFGLPHGIAFAVVFALPAWWLGHLVLLGRPVATGTPSGSAADVPQLEWYPVGRILLWIAAIAGLIVFAAMLSLGGDAAGVAAALKSSLLELLARTDLRADDAIVGALVALMPICAAIGIFLLLTLNLWLAAKITATSGRLRRSWPDLRTSALPPMTLVALCVAMAFCFTDGLLALFAKIIAAALMVAYAFTGFAVLHTLTSALKGRAFWLGSTYAIILLFTWPVLAMVMLGIADALFGLRARFLRTRPPPLPAP